MKEKYNHFVSPVVKALLEKYGLSYAVLQEVVPTGKAHRVTKSDILNYVEKKGLKEVAESDSLGETLNETVEGSLQGSKVLLRALEIEDIDELYRWENDMQIWELSNTITPFSKAILREYIASSRYDIYTTKQLRLVIQKRQENRAVGLIDLFDFEPYHSRAGVGIFVQKQDAGEGYATEALQLLKSYVKHILGLHQLYCNIQPDNLVSLKLFENNGFEVKCQKKDWLQTNNGWQDELFLQCLLD